MATLLANRHLRLARASAIARCRTTGCSSPAREFSSRCRLYNRHRPYLSNFQTTETAILTDARHPETDHNEYIPNWIDNLPRPTVAGPHCRGPLSEFMQYSHSKTRNNSGVSCISAMHHRPWKPKLCAPPCHTGVPNLTLPIEMAPTAISIPASAQDDPYYP
jgi:hypothetical protein